MKNLKRNLLFLLLGICSIVGMQKVYAVEDAILINKQLEIVCNPSQVAAGSKTKCYIVTKPDPADASSTTGGTLHGVVSSAFVTKDLKLVGAGVNPGVTGAYTAFTHEQTATGTDKLSGTDIPDEVASVRCIYNAGWVTDKSDQADKGKSDYACAIFYTGKSVGTNAFTAAKMKADATINSTVLSGYPDFGAVGYYEVELDSKATGAACGEICVKAWGAFSLAEYASIKTDATATTLREASTGACTEIQRKTSTKNPGHTPDTGAFTSYIVLVAGALIAVGAIAIAKKNNKFNRI